MEAFFFLEMHAVLAETGSLADASSSGGREKQFQSQHHGDFVEYMH